MPKSIPNPNPNPNVQDVAKPTWAHPNVRDVAKPAWAHPNVLDVAEPAWAPILAAKPPEECKTESAGRIVKKYLHPAAGRIDTGINFGSSGGRYPRPVGDCNACNRDRSSHFMIICT